MPMERRGPIFSDYERILHSHDEKHSQKINTVFDRDGDDAFDNFRCQVKKRATPSDNQGFPETAKNIAAHIVKPFNAVADEWSYIKPVAAAVLYWAITIGGVIGMGNLGYHVLTNMDKQETQSMNTEIKSPVPEPRLR